MGGARFVVGFSYTAEDRALVAPLAEELACRCGRQRVLFDLFHEAVLARHDLDVYLPRLYRDETELIVEMLRPAYPSKRWYGLEWRWIRQLIVNHDQGQIMLLRVGNPGDLSDLGIVAGDGYPDVTGRPVGEISDLLSERMADQGIPIPEAADPGGAGGAVGPILPPLVDQVDSSFALNPTRVPFMAPDLPIGFVQRPKQFEALRGLLLEGERKDSVAITTALTGAGGFGKATLAAALCHDEDIIEAFDDGILWTTLGETPDLTGALAKLHAGLTGERPAFKDGEDAATSLAERLEGKNCLVVIHDVWDRAHLEPFLRGGPGCARRSPAACYRWPPMCRPSGCRWMR